MRLPLLPLRPTAAPGDGATPPTPAAAAAMDEAWADGEMAVVRSILANIKAGDEEGAEKLACDAVANFLSTNGWIHRLGAEDAIWAKLVRNVFPKAPNVDMNITSPARMPDPPPPNSRAFFYLMCRRYKRWRKLRKKVERQAKAVAAAEEVKRKAYEAVKALHTHRKKLAQLELWRDQAEEELTQWTATAAPPRFGRLDLPPPAEHSSDEEGADAALHGDED